MREDTITYTKSIKLKNITIEVTRKGESEVVKITNNTMDKLKKG